MITELKGTLMQQMQVPAVLSRSRTTRSGTIAVVMENKEEYEGAMTRSRCRTKTTGEKQATKD